MKNTLFSTLYMAILLLLGLTVSADDRDDAEEAIDKSLETLVDFASDPDMFWFRQHIIDARGVLVFPNQFKAAYLLGGSGAKGVLSRQNDDGRWSYPAFYRMASVRTGFQPGAQTAEVVMLLMTDKAMHALMTANVQLGGDVSVALGPIGAGTAVANVDIYLYARSKGVFSGAMIKGSVISPYDQLNQAYYRKIVSPKDILVLGLARNRQASPLLDKLDSFKDSDADGITDFFDQCPETLQGIKVDKEGCWAYHEVVFSPGSADIRPEAKAIFDNVVNVLKSNPVLTVEIQVYTDTSGSEELNLELSESRARKVKDHLVTNGIAPSRLTVKGFGEENPVASNDTETGRSYNRRVKFVLTSRSGTERRTGEK